MSKILLGKILGEIYRVQRHLDISPADDATIYALLNGFENVIDEEIQSISSVSNEQLKHTMSVLKAIRDDEEKLSNFKGFYNIEAQLEAGGVKRTTAIAIIKYLKANNQFLNVISKMDSSHSPSECRTFDLCEFDMN